MWGGACKGLLSATDPRILVSTPSELTIRAAAKRPPFGQISLVGQEVQLKRPPGVPPWDL